MFSDDQVLHLDMNLKMETFAEPAAGESRYRFSWWSDAEDQHSDEFFARKPWYERSGVMEATLWGHQLQRSRGYLNGDPVRTRLRQVDEHETILESHYQQWDILEHIRLVDQDRYRYRAIYSWENGSCRSSSTTTKSVSPRRRRRSRRTDRPPRPRADQST